MTFTLFKILSTGVAKDIETINFLKSIKDDDEVTISSNGKEVKFTKKEIRPIINGLIEKIDAQLDKLEEEMIEHGYIKERYK